MPRASAVLTEAVSEYTVVSDARRMNRYFPGGYAPSAKKSFHCIFELCMSNING